MAYIIFAYPEPNNVVTGITRQEINEKGRYTSNEYKLCLDGTQIPSCIKLCAFSTRTEAALYLVNEILSRCDYYEHECKKVYNGFDFDFVNIPDRYKVWSDKFHVPAYDKYNRKVDVYFEGHVHFHIKKIN